MMTYTSISAIIAISLCFFVHVANSATVNKRIVNGRTADVLEYPWMVSLGNYSRSGEWSHYCGGILLTPTFVLTAAHCVFNTTSQTYYNDGSARINEHTFETNSESSHHDAKFKQYFMHPGYNKNAQMVEAEITKHLTSNPTNVEETAREFGGYLDVVMSKHDIALIELQQPLQNAKDINYYLADDAAFHSGESHCVLQGWGITHPSGNKDYLSDILQETEMIMNDNTIPCRNAFLQGAAMTDFRNGTQNILTFMFMRIFDDYSQICAGGNFHTNSWVSACNFDSGSPLMCKKDNKWYLYGIVSSGIARNNKACAGYGIYARVSTYIPWIESIVGSFKK